MTVKINPGIWAAVAAAALFGLSTPLAKPLLGAVAPSMLAGCLYLGSGLGLAAILLIRSLTTRSRIVWPRGTAIWWLSGATAFGGALGPYLLMRGLSATDAASASLVLNLEGVFTALLAWFVFKENFDRRIFIGMMLIFAGSLCLSLGPVNFNALSGLLLIAAACACWAIDNNLTRKASNSDALLIAAVKGLVAGSANVLIGLHAGEHIPTAGNLVKAGLLGLGGYGLSLVCFVLALRSLGTARTGAYYSLAPFLGALLAVTLGAPLNWALVAAVLLMGVGVYLHLTEVHSHWHVHEPLTHEHLHRHDAHHQHAHSDSDPAGEPHAHVHTHEALEHEHEHFPDIHHQH